MPKTPLHILTWSQDHTRYELYTRGQFKRNFSPGDADAWLAWLATVTSFAFRGSASRLNVYKETRLSQDPAHNGQETAVFGSPEAQGAIADSVG